MIIDSLPPEMLTLIVCHKRISLNERLKMRLVCKRWKEVIEKGLSLEKQITVNVGFTSEPKQTDGRRKKLYIKAQQLLSRLAPLVAKLNVQVGSGENASAELKLMLGAFRSVENLSIAHIDNDSEQSKKKGKLTLSVGQADCINAMSKLSKVSFRNVQLHAKPLKRLQPSLRRIEAFRLQAKTSSTETTSPRSLILFESLTDKCTFLELPGQLLDWHRTELGTSLVRLSVNLQSTIYGEAISARISTELRALRVLEVRYDTEGDMSTAMLRNFARLPKLRKLEVYNGRFHVGAITGPTSADVPSKNKMQLYLQEQYPGARFCSALAAWFPKTTIYTIECSWGFHSIVRDFLYLPRTTRLCLVDDGS